jgi:hypothetical protein
MMGLRNLELSAINQFVIFEMNLVPVIFGQPKVVFVEANRFLIIEQNVNESVLEFVWYL